MGLWGRKLSFEVHISHVVTPYVLEYYLWAYPASDGYQTGLSKITSTLPWLAPHGNQKAGHERVRPADFPQTHRGGEMGVWK